MARPPTAMTATNTVTLTNTVTVEDPEGAESAPSTSRSQPPKTLTLRLNRKKKQVTWKEGTVDNEFMQKKSSKKCCIFHKQKPFDEDDSDCEDDDDRRRDHGHGGDKGCCSKSHD